MQQRESALGGHQACRKARGLYTGGAEIKTNYGVHGIGDTVGRDRQHRYTRFPQRGDGCFGTE